MILAPFRKQNYFNNSKNIGKFGTDLVDSIFNTLRAIELTNVSFLSILF